MQSSLAFLKDAERKGKWDPPSLFASVGDAVRDMTRHYADVFGSSGKA
jgi:fructose-bisphosphate aldolase class II